MSVMPRKFYQLLVLCLRTYRDKNWNGTHFDSNYEFDDEFMDEWDEILQDNELFDMIVENISLSQFDASISLLAATLDNSTESLDDEMPSDILEAIERV